MGGSTQYPKGYLKRAFEIVRENGGVCVADEVSLLNSTSHLFLFFPPLSLFIFFLLHPSSLHLLPLLPSSLSLLKRKGECTIDFVFDGSLRFRPDLVVLVAITGVLSLME